MAYYTALIAAWDNGTTLPSGAAGTAFAAGDSTAQKLAKLNAWTVTGAIPTTLYATGAQIANCINWTEFAALTAPQQANLLALCNQPGLLLGGSGNTAHLVDGMLLAYFTNLSGPTIAALTALAQGAVQSWAQANGYVYNGGVGNITEADLIAAGGLA